MDPALKYDCPACASVPGEPCNSGIGPRSAPHAERNARVRREALRRGPEPLYKRRGR